mgnify:CR=1 FL=1
MKKKLRLEVDQLRVDQFHVEALPSSKNRGTVRGAESGDPWYTKYCTEPGYCVGVTEPFLICTGMAATAYLYPSDCC